MVAGLAGRWRAVVSGQPQELEIAPTGEARLVGAPYLLVVVDGAFVVPQFGLTYPYQLSGQTLLVEVDGLPMAFTRTPPVPGPAPTAGPAQVAPTVTKPEPATPPGEHTVERWGATFALPPAWFATERGGLVLLGSHSEPGLMVLRWMPRTGLAEARAQYQRGLVEDGATLLPAGDAREKALGPHTALLGRLAGQAADGSPLSGAVLTVETGFGDSLGCLALTSPQAIADLERTACLLVASLRFQERAAGAAAAVLAGRYECWEGGSGWSRSARLVLHPDGSFDSSEETARSVHLHDSLGEDLVRGGTASQAGRAGTWTAQGDDREGTLWLAWNGGASEELPYRVSLDPRDRSGYGPAVRFGQRTYQRTG
ncbi:MAG: hypothetical protein QM765_19820 [Myxococcales bacterium]